MRDALIDGMARAAFRFDTGWAGVPAMYEDSLWLRDKDTYIGRATAILDAALSLLEKPDENMIIAAINHRDEMDYSGVFVAMLNTLKAPA